MTTSTRRPSPASRAARRSRRSAPRSDTFLQRNRTRLLWVAAALGATLLVGAAYLNSVRPTYACTNIFDPTPAPSFVAPTAAPVASGATPAPAVTAPASGYVQPDMGHTHVAPGTTITYTYCPPASGRHYNAAGVGPIREGVHGPDEPAVPPGWVHNLEHGATVLLYSCKAPDGQTAEACTAAGQAELDALYARWPNSPVCGFPPGTRGTPVIARYDDMPWPYAALVWDVVLPMETIDEPQLFDFIARQAEQFNPEKLCTDPTPSPGPTGTPAPTGSPAASPAASPATSPGTSPTTTGAPASPASS